MKNDKTRVLALLMLYDNRKSLVFKVLGVVIYCILDKHVCSDYLCLQKENKLSILHKGFEDTFYDKLSRIGILEMYLKLYLAMVMSNNILHQTS